MMAQAHVAQGESQELQAWVAIGDQALTGGDSGEVRGFSPTQLGLPRLTSPTLGSMPPSWQEIVSSPMPAVDSPRRWRPGGGMADSGQLDSMPQTPWRSNPNLDPDQWSQESGEWPGPNSGPVGWMDSGMQPQVSGGAVKKMPNWQEANRVPPEDDLLFDSRLAKKSRIRRRGTSGLLPRLALLLLLLSVFDVAAVEVARPDLCPISACVSLSNKLHQAVPFLRGKPPAPPVINAAPSKMEIAATPNTTSTAQVTLANATNASIEWKAAADTTWLTIAPATGTLGVGAKRVPHRFGQGYGHRAGPSQRHHHRDHRPRQRHHPRHRHRHRLSRHPTPTPTALQIGSSRSA